MASTQSNYDITDGSGTQIISSVDETYMAIQLISTSALNGSVIVKLQQSNALDNLIDVDTNTYTIAAGENTVLIKTDDFTLTNLYLNVDVGSATVGDIKILVSAKKKDNDDNVTIDGVVDVTDPKNEEIKEAVELFDESNKNTLNSILNELKDIKFYLQSIAE